MSTLEDSLRNEASGATRILKGKTVSAVWRHSARELGIEFSDGTRLFADVAGESSIELSITGGEETV